MRLNKGKNSNHGFGLGNGGYCICPNCATKVRHVKGVSCMDTVCEKCGSTMIREGSVSNNIVSNQQTAIIDSELCIGCSKCIQYCPFDAILMENNKAIVDESICKGCMKCISSCPVDAISRFS